MFALLAPLIIAIAQSATYEEAAGLSSAGLTFTIDVGATTTTVTVNTPGDKWVGIGFGATTMTGPAIFFDVGGASTLDRKTLSYGAAPSDTLTVYWTVDSRTVNADNSITYTISRSNAKPNGCTDCYEFTGSGTIPVIYAVGQGATLSANGHSTNRRKASLSIAPSPTATPTNPVDPATFTYESCVVGEQVISGVTISLSRNTENGYMTIEIEGPDAKWFGVGFGSLSMAGTYAVISVDGTETREYRLDTHDPGTMLTNNSWSNPNNNNTAPTIRVQDGLRKVTIIRPFVYDGTYDFTKFMQATDRSLNTISAIGMVGSPWPNGHEAISDLITQTDDRGSGSLSTGCQVDDGSTPSPIPAGDTTPSSANIINHVIAVVMGFVVYIAL